MGTFDAAFAERTIAVIIVASFATIIEGFGLSTVVSLLQLFEQLTELAIFAPSTPLSQRLAFYSLAPKFYFGSQLKFLDLELGGRCLV